MRDEKKGKNCGGSGKNAKIWAPHPSGHHPKRSRPSGGLKGGRRGVKGRGFLREGWFKREGGKSGRERGGEGVKGEGFGMRFEGRGRREGGLKGRGLKRGGVGMRFKGEGG